MDVNYEIRELLDVLNDNIYGKLTIGDIAKKVGKSESTVKTLFARFQPGGIMRYYNNLKIREAKRLIREDRYTLAKISEFLCLDTPQYFSKCFKASTNMTPTEYKLSIRD